MNPIMAHGSLKRDAKSRAIGRCPSREASAYVASTISVVVEVDGRRFKVTVPCGKGFREVARAQVREHLAIEGSDF